MSVSYTHLDVYKRQLENRLFIQTCGIPLLKGNFVGKFVHVVSLVGKVHFQLFPSRDDSFTDAFRDLAFLEFCNHVFHDLIPEVCGYFGVNPSISQDCGFMVK